MDVNEWKEFANYGKAAQESQIDLLEQEKMDNLRMFDEKKRMNIEKCGGNLISKISFLRIYD